MGSYIDLDLWPGLGAYETTWPYIRILNVGEKIMVNDINGYLQSRIVFFMNIHNRYRTIYFARSGQSLIEHSYKAAPRGVGVRREVEGIRIAAPSKESRTARIDCSI
ncbi:hypothetical protein BDZ89DRAFT_532564 [Hymenopellis radicata]|nr:hypothetical protein BDZ89DRAFT_532564 [Hymenopellis radicata]